MAKKVLSNRDAGKGAKARVFLPHIGLGDANMLRITLPTLLYDNPLPLLLFDKVVMDGSVEAGFDSGDEFELRLLEGLKQLGIVEVLSLCSQTNLEPRCYRLFADVALEVRGIQLVPEDTSDKDIDIGAFRRGLSEHDLWDVFTPLAEAYLSLQVARDLGIPLIQSDPFYLALSSYILSTDRRRKVHKALSPVGSACEGLEEILDLRGPVLPLLTGADGQPVPPVPIFLRHVGMVVEGQEDRKLDEKRSWDNFERLLELRNAPLLKDFRRYMEEVATACIGAASDAEAMERCRQEHADRLMALQRAIAEEYRWIDRFARISGYLSIPLALAGFGLPPLGVASAGLAAGAVAAEAVQHALMRKREKDPEFYEKHRQFRWRLFLADLESAYSREAFLREAE